MTPLPFKTLLALITIALVQATFAQSKACLDEKEKASAMKKNCVEVNASKGTEEFNKCLEGLKAQVAKASKICESASQEPATPHAKTPAAPAASKPKPAAAPAKPQTDSTKSVASSPKPVADATEPKKEEPQILAVDEDEDDESEEDDEIAAPTSHANASGVSDKCIEELVELPNTKENFNMASFPQALATTVVKVQGGAKFQSMPIIGGMLGPGPDDKITEAGITVGCAKQMPTDVGKIKSLLIQVGLEMGKSAVASKLGVKKNEIPNNLSELKDFSTKMAKVKAGEALGIDASEVPTDLKEIESLVSESVKKQAAKKLGVEKSSIPNDKSELSAFIKKAAKAKIANELEIKPDEVKLDKASLMEYVKEEEDLAPVANLVNAANILEVLGLVNQLSALTGGGGASAIAAKVTNDDDEEDEEEEKPSKPQKNKSKQSTDDEKTRFGIRANVSNARVYPSLLQIPAQYYYDYWSGTTIQLTEPKSLYIDGGLGYGLGFFAIIPVSSFHFVPEISAQRRKPIQIDSDGYYLAITETAIEVPLTFRFFYSEDNLIYFGIGVFGGMVFDMIVDPAETDYRYVNDYRSKDYGLVLELGFRITDNFSIDARGTASATAHGIGEYLGSSDNPRLIQAQIGMSYVF